jgi:hypothetical protein
MFVGLISRNLIAPMMIAKDLREIFVEDRGILVLIAPMMIAEDLREIFVGDWGILVLDLLHLRRVIHWKEHPRHVYAFSLVIEGLRYGFQTQAYCEAFHLHYIQQPK